MEWTTEKPQPEETGLYWLRNMGRASLVRVSNFFNLYGIDDLDENPVFKVDYIGSDYEDDLSDRS